LNKKLATTKVTRTYVGALVFQVSGNRAAFDRLVSGWAKEVKFPHTSGSRVVSGNEEFLEKRIKIN